MYDVLVDKVAEIEGQMIQLIAITESQQQAMWTLLRAVQRLEQEVKELRSGR